MKVEQKNTTDHQNNILHALEYLANEAKKSHCDELNLLLETVLNLAGFNNTNTRKAFFEYFEEEDAALALAFLICFEKSSSKIQKAVSKAILLAEERQRKSTNASLF